ncbi:MAG: glycoside hydrolase family 15 protein [Brevefilum sp.]|nr:glycoside hydrolase family 15 protein [Brevefilum sp.]
MPRNLALGNGNMLVAFDQTHQIRDLYYPHVGQSNHALGHPFRVGVWVDDQFRWLDDPGWQRDVRYQPQTLVSDAALVHPDVDVALTAAEAVDFHENLLLRRFDVRIPSGKAREVRLFFHHDFHINQNEVGDTAYYEPERRAVFHYKGNNWFMINGAVAANQAPFAPDQETSHGLALGVHQWACGLKEIHNLQGTWRDAEDGVLSGNDVAHGSVDSTVGFTVHVPPGETARVWYWMAIAPTFEGVVRINRSVRVRGPEFYLERTAAFWQLWLNSHLPDLSPLPEAVAREYERSLLVIRTQIDQEGAILAANDSDISSAVRDTYSYMWPRDGALVANALTRAGYNDLPRAFYQFCQRVLTRQGYLLHKYNPDGSLASSWHPWTRSGVKTLPIQEDETALVLWSLWEHFARFGDVYFIKPLYRALICPMADFLADYIDADTGLPLPSYDLWEERYGILGWTVGATWGGLTAGANFAQAFGETERAEKYRQAAETIKQGTDQTLWLEGEQRFARMVNRTASDEWEIDPVIDASLVGLWQFGMYAPDDPKIVATMGAIKDRLWVNTSVGGIARYEDDHYHQVSDAIEDVPGNPWFITTLWLAEWLALTAKNIDDLDPSLDLLNWVAERALNSGILAEQVHPYTNAPLSVSPLTWSHAAFVSTVQTWLARRKALGLNQLQGS